MKANTKSNQFILQNNTRKLVIDEIRFDFIDVGE